MTNSSFLVNLTCCITLDGIVSLRPYVIIPCLSIPDAGASLNASNGTACDDGEVDPIREIEMNIKGRYTSLVIVGVAFYLVFGGVAHAQFTSIVDGGNWNQSTTWNPAGVPGGGDAVNIVNGFSVVVTDTQAASIIFANDDLNNSGALTVTSQLILGSNAPGVLTTSGGTLLVNQMFVGFTAAGAYVHDGNVSAETTVQTFLFIGSSGDGEVEIRGSNGTPFNASTAAVIINARGTLRVTPTANGVAGLLPFMANNLTLDPGNTLVLDDSLYTPQLGDSWDIVSATSITGAITNLVAPPGVTFSVTVAKGASLITITVTAVPAASLPASSYWGLAILVSLLPVVGLFYVARRRRSTVAID